ncbi:unnamed protein product, partial [Gulo gulo]
MLSSPQCARYSTISSRNKIMNKNYAYKYLRMSCVFSQGSLEKQSKILHLY